MQYVMLLSPNKSAEQDQFTVIMDMLEKSCLDDYSKLFFVVWQHTT